MYFIIKQTSISNSKNSKKRYRIQVDSLFEQTGDFLFSQSEPKINFYFLKYIIISFFIVLVSFILFIFYSTDFKMDKIENHLYDFLINMFFVQIAVNTFLWYIIQPIFTEIVFKQFCYKVKRKIYDNSYLYLKGENNILIFKNGKLHCDKLPAFIYEADIFKKTTYSNSPFLTYKKLKNMTESEIEGHYENNFQYNKQQWFLKGELFIPPNEINKIKDIRNMIKIKNSVNNF